MVERLSRKRVLNIDLFYLRLCPTVSIALIPLCHTRFSKENRMHLICVPWSQFHTYDRLMSVISQNNAQSVQKRFINFYYTHEGRLEGLYTNNDNYEDTSSSSSSTGIWQVDRILRTPRSRWSTPLQGSPLNSVSKDESLMVGTQQGHRNNQKAVLSPSLSSLIMWGYRPLLIVSTADRSVLHSVEVAHFHHSSRKSSEELWTLPRICWSGMVPHFRGVIA
jgi:hypothetical protein